MTVTPIEIGVVAGAFFLYSFLPGVLTWVESLRQRRAQAAALAAAARSLAGVSTAAPELGEVPSEVAAPATPSLPETVKPAPEPDVSEAPAAMASSVVDEGAHTFRLDDLRHARILETPPRAVLNDPAGQQQWEDGLQLADKYRAAVGGALLSASFEPQSHCFGGMRTLSEEMKELRFFLFPGMWPTSNDQAVGEAVFEFIEAGMVKAYVVRHV
jgi:hypothetical protein